MTDRNNVCEIPQHRLTLFIDSDSDFSRQITRRVKNACLKFLKDTNSLLVIDLRDTPDYFSQCSVKIIPTLDIVFPCSGTRRLVGDHSDFETHIATLGMYLGALSMQAEAKAIRRQLKKNES